MLLIVWHPLNTIENESNQSNNKNYFNVADIIDWAINSSTNIVQNYRTIELLVILK